MLFLIYIIIGSIWAQYALQHQHAAYDVDRKRDIACILLNFLFWPIAMAKVYFKKQKVVDVSSPCAIIQAMGELRKYPKTFHLPWSPGLQNDDRVIPSLQPFEVMTDVVVTEKIDGENTTMYHHHIHARSMDGNNHDSRNWVKALWGSVRWAIPDNVRICGENIYAKHSIEYNELSSYFYAFSVFEQMDGTDLCWSWDRTVDFCKAVGLETVPVLYRGPWNKKAIDACMTGVSKFGGFQEGYVVRNAKEYDYKDFQMNVVKFVRAHHVTTDQFWASNWTPNKLKK